MNVEDNQSINYSIAVLQELLSPFLWRVMSSDAISNVKVELILPDFGKLFYEQKTDYIFCKPHLMPLKSLTVEKLEKMQKEAHIQLKETRAKSSGNI